MPKATPVRQLMVDLQACRVTSTNKPFKYCDVEHLGPYFYRQNRSNCWGWGLLMVNVGVYCSRAYVLVAYTWKLSLVLT